MINHESMAEYLAREAMSAGFAWDIVNECPAQAYWQSCFNPDYVREEARHFDFGTAVHLAVEDEGTLQRHIIEIDAKDYRTKAAKEARDRAYSEGRVPLLADDAAKVIEIRRALERSAGGPLLFGEGRSEVSYTWEWEGIPCKARVDRIAAGHLIDLKTAISASPQAFQQAMIRDGHHLRAAWYQDGWREEFREEGLAVVMQDYLYVVVAKQPPHLVSIFRLDEQSIEWGRRLYRSAIDLFREGRETGIWPEYTREPTEIALPAWLEYQYGALEDEGRL